MADDQGWGQMGYYNHPVLKTPNLDAMAANGLRFDRFYAGAPNCSPTRATVLTARSNDRTGVENHGYALRRQEKTLAQALKAAGYTTGHFGKWHLNGYQGPGVPILAGDTHRPSTFGFDTWVSVTNFFDRDPWMSRQGVIEPFRGDSSRIIVDEALEFIKDHRGNDKPFFAVIWYGSPHSPWDADEADRKPFEQLSQRSQHHHGELVALDQSIGKLRRGLRDLGVHRNTLIWYCSDNGGLPGIEPETVGGLRGSKNTIYEGGLRVPAVIEWPAEIKQSRVTYYPASTLDIFPTIAEILDLPASAMLHPIDGISILDVFYNDLKKRDKPIPFRHAGRAAWIDNDYKLLTDDFSSGVFKLYNLAADTKETTNLFDLETEVAQQMLSSFVAWDKSVNKSIDGQDYPEKRVLPGDPERRRWKDAPEYQPFIEMIGSDLAE